MRYNISKEAVVSGDIDPTEIPQEANGSADIPTKSDGSADMRYTESKEAVAAGTLEPDEVLTNNRDAAVTGDNAQSLGI